MRSVFSLTSIATVAAFGDAPHWPRIGIHDGDNRIVWTPGCCDGDLVVIDFRDEQADGNQGKGLLTLANSTSGEAATYEIGPFWGMWKSFGPFCAPYGTHTLSFTSDANTDETSVTIVDSFGLVRGRGGYVRRGTHARAPVEGCHALPALATGMKTNIW